MTISSVYGTAAIEQSRKNWAKRHNQSRVVENESTSNSIQTSGVDLGMKALADKQYGQGIDWANNVRRQLQGLTNNRLGDLQTNYSNQLAQLQRMGGYENGRINRDYNAQAGSVGAQLAGTGLYNTTVQGNMRQGVERNRQESLGQLQEGLRGQQLASLMGLSEATSSAQGENINAQASLGKIISDLFAQRAGNSGPRVSSQLSQSVNKKYATGPW